jgi:histidinol-phosphatase (PHP family)
MHEHGVPITFGSDSHKPAQVGRDFERLIELARGAGYTDYVRFAGRQRIPHPI